MAVQVERLIATLEANFSKYDRALNKALGTTDRTFRRIETRGKQMENRMANIGGAVGRRFAAALAAGVSVRALQSLSDAATRIDNALKIAGLSGEELERVYGRLRDSAVRNATPLEGLVELYSRLALVQKDLGKSSAEIVTFTDKVAVAMRVGGRPASETAGALLQLSQALGEGIVRSQEFNSLIEGAPALLQAAAAGISEAEGSVAKLRKIMIDGELSSKALFDGVVAGSSMLEEKVANAEFSVSQSLGNLQTSLIDAVREFNNSTGAAEAFAGGINNVARAISDVDVDAFISKIRDARNEMQAFLTSVGNSSVFGRLAEFMTGRELTVGQPIALETLEAESKIENLDRQVKILEDRIAANKEMAIDTTEAQAQLDALIGKAATARAVLAAPGPGYVPGTPGDPNALAQRATTAPKAAAQISINDPRYRVSDDEKEKGAKKSREDAFARETRQIEERTEAIRAETAAMAGLNPLVDDYGFTVEKARAAQELLNAAKREGIAITPELKARIDELATGLATATVESERLAETQDELRQRAEEFSELGKDVMGGFITDLVNGKSAAEAFADALGKVGQKLLDIALNDLFKGGGGGGGGFLGIISKLFGGGGGGGTNFLSLANTGKHLFDSGGYTGAGGRKQPAGVVHKGEVVWSQNDVRRAGGVGVVEAMRRGARGYEIGGPVAGIHGVLPDITLPKMAGGSGATSFSMPISIDATGADAAGLARLERTLAKFQQEVPALVITTIRNAQKHRVPGV
jgi:tape measure domain-containing protein